jgi:hypothetical protein
MSEWDSQTTPGGVDGPQWVSAAEAADVAGVTPGTVRYWARNGLIVSEVVGGPGGDKTLVRLDEVLQHARQEDPSRGTPPGSPGRSAPADVVTDLPARTSELAPILQSIPEIMAQLTAATDRAARAETKVEFLSAQIADLRRRLAEAEAGRDGGAGVVVPEAWEPAEEPAAAVTEDAPETAHGVTGWPAPPPDALREARSEETVEAPEPGPEAIDWTSRASGPDDGDGVAAVDEAPAVPAARAESDLSLDDIWNEPVAPTVMTPADEGPDPGPPEVDWYEPAGRGESPPPPPAANAPVPAGDDFLAPRRRRWFRRRR